MEPNPCEYINDSINIQYLLRQLLRLVNDNQIDCSNNDCIDNIDNSFEHFEQVDHGIGSTTLTFGYVIFLFLILSMVLPTITTIPSSSRSTNRSTRTSATKQKEKVKKFDKKFDNRNNDDDNDPGLAT